MGIAGLLPFLESAKREVNLEDLAGKRVAVDGHCWLHAAVGVMKDKLLEGTTEPVYLNYIKFRLFQLLKHKIIPIIVFDGQSVPIKSGISEDRKKKREIALEKAEQLTKENKPAEARKQLERTLKVTEDMIHHTIKLLDQYRVQHIIAPFEADPQLAYLSLTNQVEAIFTVDSDLLVFGCKQVIFPKRGAQGKGYYSIKQDDIFKVKEHPADELEEASSRKVYVDLTSYNAVKLRHVCILSGCDYLKSLPKVGLKTAFSSLKKSNHDIDLTIKGLCQSRNHDTDEYMAGFRNANAGFLYQYVFDPRIRMYTRMSDLPECVDFDLNVLGESPVGKDIPLLRSNGAIIATKEVEQAIVVKEKKEGNTVKVEEATLQGIMGKLESLSIKQTTTSSNVEINKTTLLDVKTTNKEDNDFDSTSSLEEEEFYKLTNAEENQWDELAEQLETLYIRSTMEAEERVTVDELVVESLAAKWKMKGKEVEEECLK